MVKYLDKNGLESVCHDLGLFYLPLFLFISWKYMLLPIGLLNLSYQSWETYFNQ